MNLLFENFGKLIDAPNGIEKARELILQLAVRGKLVKQDPKDEPASELLKKIKKEKEKLIAEGKIKKQKELLPIKDEEKSFELPKGWEWGRMCVCGAPENNSIVDGPFGSNLVLADYDPNGKYPVISISNIDEGFDYETLRKINEKKFQELKRSAVRSGDILIAKIGSSYGKVGLYPNSLPIGIIPANLLKITMNPLLDKDYVVLYLKSSFFKELLDKIVKFTAQPAFNMSAFKELLFIVPPFEEQIRIVERVNRLMLLLDELEEKRERKHQKKIKLNNASLDKLLNSKDEKELKLNWKRIEENLATLYSVSETVEKLKQAILQLAVQGKLVKQDPKDEPASELLKKIKKEKEKLIAEGKIKKQKELLPIKDEEKSFELPKGWEWCKIGNIAQHNSGKTLDSKRNTGQPRKCITTSNLYWGYFELLNLKEILIEDRELDRCQVSKGDLLVCEGGEAGRAAIWNYDEKVCFQNHIHRVRPFGKVNSEFLYWYFYLLYLSDEISKYRKGVGINNLSGKALSSVIFPLPPLIEQKRIVEKVNELMSLCKTLEEKLKKKEETAERFVGAVVKEVTNN